MVVDNASDFKTPIAVPTGAYSTVVATTPSSAYLRRHRSEFTLRGIRGEEGK